MEQQFDLGTYIRILRRRYLFLIVPAVLAFVAVVVVAYRLPSVFKATATILVESQQIPTSLVQPTVTGNAVERLAVIQQRFKARDVLLQIVESENLFPGKRDHLSPTEIVDLMRESIDIEPAGSQPSGVITFTVSFSYGEPKMAAKVANGLVELILEQNIQSRTTRASETNTFFEQRVTKLADELATLESRIATFKNENQSSLPESLSDRRKREADVEAQIADIDTKLATLTVQRDALKQRALNDPNGIVSTTSTQSELDRLRSQLVQLQAVFSDSHPEVRRLTAQIKALAATNAATPAVIVNPASEAVNAGTNEQLRLVESQLEALQERRADLKHQVGELGQSIDRTPQVEVAFQALTREYESAKAQYASAKAKLAEASTGEQMEQDRQAEKFEVIDQAEVPTRPVQPNRPRILLAGLFGSIALGIGLVLLLELMDKTVHSAADLERRMQLRPISVIPYISTAAERAAKRWQRAGVLVVGIAAVASALVIIQTQNLPLDLIAKRILHGIGGLNI